MSERSSHAGIEERLWPIVCATAVLMGVLSVVVWSCGDFEDDRLIFNGYSQLAAVAALGAAIVYSCSRIRGAARRTAELAVLLSLALHAVGGLCAVYLFDNSLGVPGSPGSMSASAVETDDDPPAPPDYHWGQSDEDQGTVQAFEKPVETNIRDQAVSSAAVEPRDIERPVPAAEVPHAAKPEPTPLSNAAAVPGKPLVVDRPDAAKVADLPPVDALAMLRQKGAELPVPDASTPAPTAMPETPMEPAESIEARGVQAKKSNEYLWAKVAKRSIDPNKAPETATSDPLPSPEIVARVPSKTTPRNSPDVSGTEAADEISQRGSTLARSNRGVPLPATALPDGGRLPQLPASAGGSSGSRLDTLSNVAVEGSENSHAPLGPNIASAGTEDFANGSSLLPTRRGALDGRGRAEPSIAGNADADPDELRGGAPRSSLRYGMSQPAAPARRALASQTADGGSDASAGQSATLPRTQAETGLPLPASAGISDSYSLPGAGGVASRPGGMPSTLDVGRNIAVRRVAGDGTPRGRSREEALGGPGVGEAATNNAMPGLGPIAPRRVEQDAAAGDDNIAGSIPRSRAADVDLRATADPAGSLAGSGTAMQGPTQGSGPQGASGRSIAPASSLASAGRLFGPGQAIGGRPAASSEPGDISSSVAIASPQRSGLADRSRQADSPLDNILSGDESTRDRNRGRGQIVVNSLVREPLDSFRHGPGRGGAALGDPGDGQLTEPAIENGLEYFAHTQFPDGHWSLHEAPPGVPMDPSSLGELRADTAATGLALLAYLAAGYTQEDEKYRDTVRRGLNWLVKHQSSDGNLSYRGSDPTHFYSQGIATMALCEAYGMTQDREIRAAAQKAIDFIVAAQDPNRGGWRYVARDGSDTSVTGWQLMALRSGQMAGLNVPEETLRKVGHWLDLAQTGRGTYVYNPWNLDTAEERKGRVPNPTITAQAMVMRMYLGQDKDHVLLRQGAEYLLAHLPEPAGAETQYRDCYYWYYGNKAMYLMKGDYWKTWDARVTPLVRAGQVARGPLKGSWNGDGPVPDIWNSKAGRHYVTAMHVLTLEFRYWHLPLFRELRRD